MDQSKSSNASSSASAPIEPPKRHFNVEFFVGLFSAIGLACAAWLAAGLGGIRIGTSDSYDVFAEFDNISGLQTGASVEIAGVPVGEVSSIELKDPQAKVTLRMQPQVKLRDDDIASIRTKGIIGDRYVKISRGASDQFIAEGGTITETESVVDIEDILGKFVHSIGNSEEKSE
jgi:phospholipid/cholesterol/gamma-HCH transport system substrate-binding protein